MIEELKRANASLSDDVAEQSDRVQALEREVKKSRIVLKNEYSDIVGRSPRMMEVLTLVDRITDADIPVWVFGESGTGKEAIARSLHFNGGRAKKPFVTENCSALPEGLLESELFGHKKGAFTHATSDKKGILQYANGGTIFLDEIADMSLNLQAKLLRFLQEGEIRPIGSSETLRVDVRVVSASNKDLAKLVEEGKFREDLFYRLNGVTVRLPPLRERAEDLPLLAAHFLKKIAEKTKKPLCVLDPAALRLFHAYSWPGNIRELQNTLQTAVLFAEKGNVTPVSLGFKPALFASGKSPESPRPVRTEAAGLDPDLEKTLLAVRDHCYHKGHAAKALGIARRTLYARLQRFGIGTDRASLKSSIEKYFG
jgi:transcriptional regulator with PAS, ATPase and Fis domain